MIPNLVSYDPAYAYETAVIVQEGIRRMHELNEDVFYYLTIENEAYVQPRMPDGDWVREGILRGIYRLDAAPHADQASLNGVAAADPPQVRLLGSGPILNEVRAAQRLLWSDYGVAADVWSVTSWTELRRDAQRVARWNLMHPLEEPRASFVRNALGEHDAPIIAATDYLAALPDQVAKWLPGPLTALGTDGFGRSGTRDELRDFFEIDARHIVWAALSELARAGCIEGDVLLRARDDLKIDADRPDPMGE